MKGLFIPEITAEMFRNGCLESIEALMAMGEIYDIDYSQWIPCSERLPEEDGDYIASYRQGKYNWVSVSSYRVDLKKYSGEYIGKRNSGWVYYNDEGDCNDDESIIAWMPLPKPYEGGTQHDD